MKGEVKGAGETAPWLRVLVAFAEYLGLVPRIHMETQSSVTLFHRPDALFWPGLALHAYGALTCM